MKTTKAIFLTLAINVALAVPLQAQVPITNTFGGVVGYNYTNPSAPASNDTSLWDSLPGHPQRFYRVPTGTQNVASYLGCGIFTSGDYYNNDIFSAPLDPNSAAYIASVASHSPGEFNFSKGLEFINLADASTPRVSVSPKVQRHANEFAGVLWPWRASFKIEPASDRHTIVLDLTNHMLYETWSSVTTSNGGLSAYSGAHWDLSQPFPVGEFKPSGMASGLSMFAGGIKWEELETGVINHALNFLVQAHGACDCPVPPADATDGISGPADGLPYGGHLRLHASFPEDDLNAQQRAVVHALKHYGMFLADTGNSGNAFYTITPLDGDDTHYQLGNIHFTLNDFDVVTSSAKPAGTSLGLYPGVTVNGAVGSHYIIQSTVHTNKADSWVTVTNLTLTQPEQVWVDTAIDASLPANAAHFYRVLAAP